MSYGDPQTVAGEREARSSGPLTLHWHINDGHPQRTDQRRSGGERYDADPHNIYYHKVRGQVTENQAR